MDDASKPAEGEAPSAEGGEKGATKDAADAEMTNEEGENK